jgi:hypothetical protein
VRVMHVDYLFKIQARHRLLEYRNRRFIPDFSGKSRELRPSRREPLNLRDSNVGQASRLRKTEGALRLKTCLWRDACPTFPQPKRSFPLSLQL